MDDLIDEKDSNRVNPKGYVGAHSVNEAIELVEDAIRRGEVIELIDLDHDLGDYAPKFLDYLVEHEIFPPVKFHTSNITGRNNMRTIVNRFWPEDLKIY